MLFSRSHTCTRSCFSVVCSLKYVLHCKTMIIKVQNARCVWIEAHSKWTKWTYKIFGLNTIWMVSCSRVGSRAFKFFGKITTRFHFNLCRSLIWHARHGIVFIVPIKIVKCTFVSIWNSEAKEYGCRQRYSNVEWWSFGSTIKWCYCCVCVCLCNPISTIKYAFIIKICVKSIVQCTSVTHSRSKKVKRKFILILFSGI